MGFVTRQSQTINGPYVDGVSLTVCVCVCVCVCVRARERERERERQVRYVIVNPPQPVLYAWSIMHECGNLIQHEGEALSIQHCWGALTGLYPTVVTSTSVVSGFDH